MKEFISNFRFDFWTIWGIVAQGMFFSRFILQWVLSEREKKVVIPRAFWFLSLIGACMVLVYAFVRYDLVFLITGILQIFLYSRNLILSKNQHS